jgi:glycosyltransferase involved in cell wall biosynthesis
MSVPPNRSDASPAKVALVTAYPYEALRGGEGAYLAALRGFLLARGHRVDTLITDITRGRFNPALTLPPEVERSGALRIRRAVRIGEGRYLSADPGLALKAVGAALGHRGQPDERLRPGERDWLLRAIASGAYDAVILMWDATRHAADIAPLCDRVLALKGFCLERKFRLGEDLTVAIPPALVADLEGATLIGMNNAAETRELRRLLPASTIIQVGMGFPEQPEPPDGAEPVVLFVGANSGANRRALDWLVDDIWPRIARDRPEARLRIVGSVRDGWNRPVPQGVEMLGRVASLAGEYRRAQVVVAPLTNGTAGVKVKVAEALSHGRPLVTTSLGVDPGAPDQFGAAVDVADDAGGFADAVSRLLADPHLRRERARLVRDAFRANFSEAAAYGALSSHLGL